MSKNYQTINSDGNQITLSAADDSFVADESMRDYSEQKIKEDNGQVP
jgi:hypothetical protein